MTAPDYVAPAPTGWWVKAPLGLLNYSDDFNRDGLGPDWVQRNGTYSMTLRDNDIAYSASTDEGAAVISWAHHLNVDDIMVKGVTAERSNAQTNVALGIGGSDKVAWANTSNNTYYSLHTSTNWDWWGTGIIMRGEDPFADFTAGIDVMLSLERIGTLFVVRANGFIYQYWDDVNGYVPLDDTHRYVMCGVQHPQAGSNAGGWTSFGVTETPQSRPNWLMADWGGYSDNFNRDDADQLGWWWYDQSVNRLGLVDNQLRRPDFGDAGVGTVMWPGATTFADLEVTFTVAAVPASGEQIIVALASSSTDRGVAAFVASGGCFIGTATDAINWGVGQTNRSGDYTGTISDGDVFVFRRVGSVYTLEQNGTQRCEWDDTGGYMPIDRFHVWQKICIYRDTSGPSTARIDNWSWSELYSDRIMNNPPTPLTVPFTVPGIL